MRACVGVRKNRWTPEETEHLREVVAKHGAKSWTKIASLIPGRNAKQCRERWSTYCDPEFTRDKWTAEEEDHLMELHKTYGNRWSSFSRFLNNRSPVAIRNRWMCINRRAPVSQAENPPSRDTGNEAVRVKPIGSTVTAGDFTDWQSILDDLFTDLPDSLDGVSTFW